MSKPRVEDGPQNVRDRITEKSRGDVPYTGRDNSGERSRGSSLPSGDLDDDSGRRLRWFPTSLVVLVVLCLILAAWVWFEILRLSL